MCEHPEVAGAVRGHRVEPLEKRPVADDQGGLERRQVPRLRRRRHDQRVPRPGHRQVRRVLGPGQRGVDLVRDHHDAEPLSQPGHGGQLVDGVDGAVGVVRRAQEEHLRPLLDEGGFQSRQVEPVVDQGHVHQPTPGGGDHVAERRVDRGVDDDGVAGLGEGEHRLPHASDHIRGELLVGHVDPPTPLPFGVVGECLLVGGQLRVAGVSVGERAFKRRPDRRGQVHVHLGHEKRQHVGLPPPPLDGAATAQLAEGDVEDRHDPNLLAIAAAGPQ